MLASADGSASAHSSPQKLVLGVDGGGTKTLAWLARCATDGSPQVIGIGTSGSSNQVAVGYPKALDELASAVYAACENGKTSTGEINAAAFALAGSGNTEARDKISEFVGSRFKIQNFDIVHDGQAVLAAGTTDGWGIALIAGTGSVAFGRTPNGDTKVVGGWGYWFGDEGSAFWLGQQALRAVALSADGRGPETQLTELVGARLGISSEREILTEIAKRGDVRLEIANLANVVCDATASGDESANSILNQAVQYWLDHIISLAGRLSLEEPLPIALAGGVLCGSELARSRLSKQLAERRISTSQVQVVNEPVAGCVKLAQKLIRN